MSKLLIYALLVSLICINTSGYAQTNQQNDIAIITASRASSNAAIARHDIDGIAKYWLNDFVQTIGRAHH